MTGRRLRNTTPKTRQQYPDEEVFWGMMGTENNWISAFEFWHGKGQFAHYALTIQHES